MQVELKKLEVYQFRFIIVKVLKKTGKVPVTDSEVRGSQ